MINRKFYFQPCSATAGKPFEDGPKCPLYVKTNNYLQSNGWQQMFYNTCKTGSGDLCNTKYKKIEAADNDKKSQDVLGTLEINIEGTKKTCTLTAVVTTYHPKNILQAIDHGSEKDIMENLESFFKQNAAFRHG
jgi:hypothetical protein